MTKTKILSISTSLSSLSLLASKAVIAADINLGEIEGPGEFQKSSSTPAADIEKFISVIVGALTAVAGIAFLLYFIISAFGWITSGGDKQKTTQAKDGMTHAAIGLIAVVVAYFIASIIGTVLGIDILTPSSFLK